MIARCRGIEPLTSNPMWRVRVGLEPLELEQQKPAELRSGRGPGPGAFRRPVPIPLGLDSCARQEIALRLAQVVRRPERPC